MNAMMSGLTRIGPHRPAAGAEIAGGAARRDAVPVAVDEEDCGLAASVPPTQMAFFAVLGEPSVGVVPAPRFPAETVTTMFGFANSAVSRLLAPRSEVESRSPTSGSG